MRWIIGYLLTILLAVVAITITTDVYGGPEWKPDHLLLLHCTFVGMIAGVLYCLRAVYVNQGLDRWDSAWTVWYYLRPITSGISGFASSIFLQAGLLALSSKPQLDGTPYGYFAIAFIAGYNVDFFMKKLEHVAKELWGIEESRASKDKQETESESENQEDTQ